MIPCVSALLFQDPGSGVTLVGLSRVCEEKEVMLQYLQGKFHGVMAATTPTGSLMVTMRKLLFVVCNTSPYTLLPSSANQSTEAALHSATPFENHEWLMLADPLGLDLILQVLSLACHRLMLSKTLK